MYLTGVLKWKEQMYCNQICIRYSQEILFTRRLLAKEWSRKNTHFRISLRARVESKINLETCGPVLII